MLKAGFALTTNGTNDTNKNGDLEEEMGLSEH
jgi:hypothetical protein